MKILRNILFLILVLTSTTAFGFDVHDLVQVVYNENDYEVAVNLGSLDGDGIDISQSNYSLTSSGTVNLNQFGANVDGWNDLRMAFFSASQDYSAYGAWFATTKNTLSGFSDIGTFLNSVYNLYTYYGGDGDDELFIGSSTNLQKVSYSHKLCSNGTAPGFYAGVNSADKDYGEADLSSLNTIGYVDMYVYHIVPDWDAMVMAVDKGDDTSTDYVFTLRFMADGSVILNPPPPANNPPVISGDPATSVNEDTSYSFIPAADDDEDDDLTFSISNKPAWADFSSSNGSLSGTPANNDVGITSDIIISVSDGNNDPVSLDAFSIEVVAVNDPPVISGTPATSVNEDTDYSFTPDAVDEEGEELVFSINKIPSWASFNTSTGKLTGTPSNVDGDTGTTGIIISVSDGNSSDSLSAFDLSVVAVNDPPVISGTPAASVNEDTEYSFTPEAVDEEGAELTFSINKIPSWALFNTATGNLSGTPSNIDGGTITNGIIISVSDGNSSNSLPAFDLTVAGINDPPVIGGSPALSVDEDSQYSFTPTASDEEEAELTFSINNTPTWASFNTSTGELSGTPENDDVGTTSGIIISVSDGVNNVSLGSFDITVVNTNDMPTISGTPAILAIQDQAYSFTPASNDVDAGDILSFSIVNKPAWAHFNAETGQLSGTPSVDNIGTTSGIVISVTDGNSDPASLPAFNLQVKSSNNPPVISGNPPVTIDEDSPYLFTPGAGDPDTGDELTFSITNKPSWASFNTATGELSGTPLNEHVGITAGIVISVSDSVESASLDAFSITVNNTNDIPTIGGTPQTETAEDVLYSFTPSSNDDDAGDTLIFSITNKPSWASFNTASGELSGTPSNSDVGTANGIVISVTDGNSEPVSMSAFNLKVVNKNDIPTITGEPETTADEDIFYSFTPAADDVDTGDILTFSIAGKPSWAAFDSSTGTLSGTPVNEDVGTTSGIVISVTDGNSDPVSLPSFNLEVINVNDTPEILEIGDRSILRGGNFNDISLDDYVEDVDNLKSELTWECSSEENNINISIDENNSASVTVTDADWFGSQDVIFTVTDPDGADDSQTVKFTVVPNPPKEPGINSPSDGDEVHETSPVLSVNNSTSELGTVTYDFELAGDETFLNVLAGDYDFPQGEGITSWDLSLQFPDLELTENTTYYWRAKAVDTYSESEWVYSSFVVNAVDEAPTLPVLSLPANNVKVSSLNPVIEILNSSDPDGDDISYLFEIYDVEPAGDEPGGSVVLSAAVNEESDGSTSWTVGTGAETSQLDDNAEYWWRVRAVDEDGLAGDWLGFFRFITDLSNDAPSRPAVLSPLSNGTVDTYTPSLTVENSTDEDYGDVIKYIYQIDTENGFNSTGSGPMDEAEVSQGSDGTTSWITSELIENTRYYWRVKASDGEAESSWISASFTVDVYNEAPEMPLLRYPEDNVSIHSSGITLRAHGSDDPDGNEVYYRFQVCESGGDCLSSDLMSNPEWTLTSLSNNTEYTWAVKAVDENGAESEWSDSRIFQVITNYTPNPPGLNNPVSGGTVNINEAVVLSVKNSSDDDGDSLTYYFEIYSDLQLSDLVEAGSAAEGNLITEYKVQAEMAENETYYWRAYVSDGSNDSSYSSTFNFICSSEDPEYDVDVVESQVVYASMLDSLGDGEYYDVTVNDETSDLDGVTVSIPNGAVDTNINITVGIATGIPALPSGVAVTGRVINLGPEGTQFNNPVIIKVPYTEDDLTAMDVAEPLDLILYTYSSSATGWEILEPVSADKQKMLVSFEVSHFSIFTFGASGGSTSQGGDSDGGSTASASGGGGGCFIETASWSSLDVISGDNKVLTGLICLISLIGLISFGELKKITN